MRQSPNKFIGKAKTLLGLQFLSDFGDQITNALLALCILDITKSTGKVGLVYFTTTVGFILFTLAGGVLGDKIGRRNILVFSDLGRSLVVLLMVIAISQKSILLIYATSFLLSILGAMHGPVKISTWAENIPRKRLESFNSLSEFSLQASTVMGPLIASFFIVRDWINLGFALDALTFLTCAFIFSKIVSNKNSQATSEPSEKRDLFKGFKIIAKNSEMAKYVAYDAIQMVGLGAFNATFLVLAQRDFGWSKIEYSYHLSLVAALTALGALAGATNYAAKINQKNKLATCALISAFVLWAALQAKSFPLSSIFIGLCDALAVLTVAVTRTKIQLVAKNLYPNFISSIIASRVIIVRAATLLGIGACLIIDDFISLEATLSFFVLPIALSMIPLFWQEKQSGKAARTIAHVKITD